MNKNDFIDNIYNSQFVKHGYKEEYVNRVRRIEDNFPILISRYHLSSFFGIEWFAYKRMILNINNLYRTYYIPKKRGGKREISIPDINLKTIQKKIYLKILKKIKISEYAFGFVDNKSIYDNAKFHVHAASMLSIDLKDFFPTISFRRVYYIFKELCGYCNEVSYDLAKLVTYKNILPQGSPSSPALSNIAAYKLDFRLFKYALQFNYKYSRYADDITFSSEKHDINFNFYKKIQSIIEDEGFFVNENKTRISNKPNKLEITGLYIIDNQIKVPGKYIRKIRQELYYVKKFGVNEHKEYTKIKNRFYLEHLLGKILFVNNIHSEIGKDLLNQFNEIYENY